MYAFDYQRPNSIEEAAEILAADEEARPLAGGMTLIPTLKQRLAQPTILVDLGGIEALRGVRVEGRTVTIGGMTRHADVAMNQDLLKVLPALAGLAEGIGDPHVRNRGTIGGSIANADPAADYPSSVLGLNATIVTSRREIPGDAFFIDLFETVLEPGEILTAVRYPIPERAAYVKFPNPASRYATVGVFVAKTGKEVRVAVTGAAGSVFRIEEMEAALARRFDPAVIDGIEISPDGLNDDVHAAADYRAHLIKVMARRAVAACR